MKVREGLESCSLGLLREIAARRGLAAGRAELRRELIDRLEPLLADPTAGRTRLEGLPEPGRVLLAEIGAHAGALSGGRARRWLEFSLGVTPAVAEALIGSLVAEGLLFRTFRASGPERGEWLAVADELLPLLPRPRQPERPAPVRAVESAEVARGDPLLDLLALVEALRRSGGVVEPEQLHALPRAGAAELDELLPAGERWRFLAWLALRLGWLARRGGRLQATERFREALAAPEPAWSQLWRGYLSQPGWDERRRLGGPPLPEPRRAREAILDALLELGTDWYDCSALADWIAACSPGLGPEPASDKAAVSARDVAVYVLAGPLRWLGLLAIVRQPGGAVACRLGEVGRALLRGEPAASSDRSIPGQIDPSGRVVVGADTDLLSLSVLCRYLEPTEAGWRLSRASFVAGLQAGGSGDDAVQRLAGVAGARAAHWEMELRRWEAEARGGALRPMLLLDLQQHPDGGRLLADPQVRRLIARPLGPGEALIRPDDAEALRARLLALGVVLEPGAAAVAVRPLAGERVGRQELALAAALLELVPRSRLRRIARGELEALRARLGRLAGEPAVRSARARLGAGGRVRVPGEKQP